MITKVISGGQTGADIAGLRAAKAVGLATGGYMTKGCRTLDGPKPEYLDEYNMFELQSKYYADRTRANVYHADATIRFATDWNSPGERCTLKAIKSYGRPYLDIPLHTLDIFRFSIIEIIIHQGWRMINIAGNSERTSPGIEKKVESFLYMVFDELVKA